MSFLPSTSSFNDSSEHDDPFFVHHVIISVGSSTSSGKERSDSNTTLMTADESVVALNDSLPPPLPPSPTTLAKSAIKLNYDIKDIPVCTRKRSWKTLPPPNMEQVNTSRINRVESMCSFFHLQDENSPPPSPKMKKSSSKVSFVDITIREYDQTLGDNPSVSYGPPVSLDWNYSENEAVCLNEYEGQRPKRRSLRQMGLNYYQRKHLLTQYGYSEAEMKKSKREVSKVKSQRAITKQFLQLQKVEDVIESASRKAKRIFGGSGGRRGSNSSTSSRIEKSTTTASNNFTEKNYNDNTVRTASTTQLSSSEEEDLDFGVDDETPPMMIKRCVSAPGLLLHVSSSENYDC